MDNVGQIIQRAKDTLNKQSLYHTYWDDLARVHLPRMLGFSENREVGERYDDVFDGTPLHAARGLANSIGGLLRPDGEEWVRMKAADEDINDEYEAQLWFEVNGDRMRKALENPKSQMKQCTGEVDLGLTVFGTAPFWIGENRNRDGLLFQSIPLKEAGIDWGEEGVRGFYRFKSLTAIQAADKWGRGNLHEECVKLLDTPEGGKKKFNFINAVMQRHEAGRFKSKMPFASLWIDEQNKHIVTKGGFMEFPYIVPRMETSPGEDLGRSPAMIALPDSNTAQAMAETILIAGQRAADPPIFAPNDGSFSAANTFPGGISYYDVGLAQELRGNPIFPMNTGHNLPITRDMQRDTRDQIYNAFFRNILNLPIDGPEKTAYEVMALKEEMKREIGPMFGRLESNYTAPMVERVFMIMLRAGAFTEIPDVLLGKEIVFEYESPVKRVRQMIEIEASRAFKAEMVELSQFDPTVMDNFDTDEYARTISEALRAPKKLLRDPARVDEIRANRAAQEAAQQQELEVAGAAQVAKTGAETAKIMQGVQ